MTTGVAVMMMILVAMLVCQFGYALMSDCPIWMCLFAVEIILFAFVMRSF